MSLQIFAIILCFCLLLPPIYTQENQEDARGKENNDDTNQQNFKSFKKFIANNKYKNKDLRNPGKNTLGIALFAAGIVVGTVLIAGLIIGTLLLIRWKKRKAAMEEEKRKLDEEKLAQEREQEQQQAEEINNNKGESTMIANEMPASMRSDTDLMFV